MRLAVMQPYFQPYLGYFALIAASDHFVVFDPVQYIRRGWVNRNRILKPGFSEDQYVRVPVAAHRRETPIRDIRIAPDPDWKGRIVRQLAHYESCAPYFSQTMSILDACLALETDRLVELNVHCLKVICTALRIPFAHSYFGELEAQTEPVNHPGQWALQIAIALGARSYVNPIGGHTLFDADEFRRHDIELLFLQHTLPSYPQGGSSFIRGLSILDVLMFNDLVATKQLVNEYKITIPQLCCNGAA